MNSVSCILLLVERGAGHRGLDKALLLARHFGARLELLLCETQCPAAALTTDSPAAERMRADYIGEGQRYLEALRQTMASPEVEIGAEVICAPTLASGLAHKLQQLSDVKVVVKAGRATAGLVPPLDWRLLERCPAPLLLTAGRPWRAIPRFAAALDLSDQAHRALSTRIVALSEMLAGHCGAELDYLYAGRIQGGAAHTASEAHRRLHALLPAGPGLGRLQYCSGDPATVLPRLIARRDYDLLAVGAAPRGCPTAYGKLTAALVRASAGDVLLVPAAMNIDDSGGKPEYDSPSGMDTVWQPKTPTAAAS